MKKILIIEDHEIVRETLIDVLENQGFLLKTACDGVEGILAFKDFKPDLTLCDFMMPKLDGFEVFRILNTYGLITSQQILFLTAQGNSSKKLKEIGLSERDKLSKPFQIEELLLAINVKLE